MSYHTWATPGFGICVDDICKDVSLTLEKVLNLAKMEPSVYEIVMEYLNGICERDEIAFDELTIEDIDELEGDYCERGIAFVLYNVITELPVVYADSFDGDQYVLYSPGYPWTMQESERSLSEKDVVKIFAKYVSILTDIPINVDYYNVENGG